MADKDEEGKQEVLLCDSCNAEAHIGCLGLEEVPKDDWLCQTCEERSQAQALAHAKRHASLKDSSGSSGLSSSLAISSTSLLEENIGKFRST